ncbi:hypothetical protein JHL21_04030 [Devosia sp. WQ 349]|uniref:flagellin N-terminal helical domain-containing protein n=1 Tax=Devosia sp. WQ 349K1 TaxID=2800329 RepID=UPI0019033526|nr:flagellin [Devosia sp. WQ 349K1]MBK1793662.1 hypothetical protein [Devosia sp. WQ 349K1]
MSDISLSKAVRTNLLSLQNTAQLMEKTQQRLATGNKVNSALDNPSNFFTASALNSRAADMSNLLDSMASGIKVIEAANNGLTALTKNLESMQSTLRQARQDKSFQTQSFDVTDASVLRLKGGQLGDTVSELSLATATVDGQKATVQTIAATSYRGPVIASDARAGTGARAIISADAGFKTGDTFSVAGQTVTVTGATPDAESVAENIRLALDGHEDTQDEYTVSIGAASTPFDGKIIIETVRAKDPAATINLDPDNNPETGVTQAIKGSISFNYSDVSTAIEAGGQTITTGGSFSQFVENLRSASVEGGYSVDVDEDTKQITLTALTHGANPPTITGVTPSNPGVEASPASLTFRLNSDYQPASTAQTTFQLTNSAGELTSGQILTIDIGTSEEEIELVADATSTEVEAALRDHIVGGSTLGALYSIAVDDDFNVSISALEPGAAAAPVVTSDAIGIRDPSEMNAAADGEDLRNHYAELAGARIVLATGSQPNTEYEFDASVTSADVNAFLAELQSDGYTAAFGTDGLTISRATGESFSINVFNGTGDAADALGIDVTPEGDPVSVGAGDTDVIVKTPTVVTPGADATPGPAAALVFSFGLEFSGATSEPLGTHQELKIGDFEVVLQANMSASEVEDAINAITDFSDDWVASVDDDFVVTITAAAVGDIDPPTVAVMTTQPSQHTPTDGINFSAVDTAFADFDGQEISVSVGGGAAVDIELGNTLDEFNQVVIELQGLGFTVSRTQDGISLSRTDGEAFTFTTTDVDSAEALGHEDAFTTPVSIDATDIDLATQGIVGGNIAVDSVDGEDATVGATLPADRILTINGEEYEIFTTTTPADLQALLADEDDGIGADYDVEVADDFTVTITAKTAGEEGTITFETDAAMVGTPDNTPGIDAADPIYGTPTAPEAGAHYETVAAATNIFTVSYGAKTADIRIGGIRGGTGDDATAPSLYDISQWESATVESINAQLAEKGITGVEAQFDSVGKLSIIAKNAEAQTLAIAGQDAVALFGTNAVSTGVAERSELTSIKTVDKFVELINRDHASQVRASNDNGRLRIENLSTQRLEIDISGANAPTTLNIEGNSVRANLSKQFNELRDQLDKLADDSSFNGINLLRGDKLKITFNESGSSAIDIQAKDQNGNVRSLNSATLNVASLDAQDLDTDAKIDAFLTKLSAALSDLRSQSSTFGSNLSSVQNRQDFTKSMITTLETGAANLTLADMNEEAANLLALQTRQSLSTSALSMASQGDQNILQLLR